MFRGFFVSRCNDHEQSILNLLCGSPLLGFDGFMPLNRAANVLGFEVEELLRPAATGELSLHHAVSRACGEGVIVAVDSLELVDPEVGSDAGYVIPDAVSLPSDARPVNHQGRTLPISAETAVQITSEGLDAIGLLALGLVNQPRTWFIPRVAFGSVPVGDLLVQSDELNALRAVLAAQVTPERIKQAQDAAKNGVLQRLIFGNTPMPQKIPSTGASWQYCLLDAKKQKTP
jgi:hypothetical protein